MANDRKRELMLSYYPQECAEILNGDSPFDVRFNFPYDWACEQIKKYGGFYINMYCKKVRNIFITNGIVISME